VRQDQAEEGDLLAKTPDLDHRLAEVDLGVARRVPSSTGPFLATNASSCAARPSVVTMPPGRQVVSAA